jgi:hypothetical protein
VDLGLVVGEETEEGPREVRMDLNLSLSVFRCLPPILCLVGVD